ncbi:MAG: hypothetical protein D6698_09830 [Gammaproteobacteria bacterium]|nr:MAG: hypothetical protein D6698_09830 [Gammaproteobacteria bacterium]
MRIELGNKSFIFICDPDERGLVQHLIVYLDIGNAPSLITSSEWQFFVKDRQLVFEDIRDSLSVLHSNIPLKQIPLLIEMINEAGAFDPDVSMEKTQEMLRATIPVLL